MNIKIKVKVSYSEDNKEFRDEVAIFLKRKTLHFSALMQKVTRGSLELKKAEVLRYSM